MSYWKIVEENKPDIRVSYLCIINDETLSKSYCIRTNLHLSFGISLTEEYTHLFTRKKGVFNKTLAQFKKHTGKKPRLVATNNSLGYTRLLYKLV